jgi:hypothetical protein
MHYTAQCILHYSALWTAALPYINTGKSKLLKRRGLGVEIPVLTDVTYTELSEDVVAMVQCCCHYRTILAATAAGATAAGATAAKSAMLVLVLVQCCCSS